MDKRLYWLWLQQGLGFGANVSTLLSSFGSAQNLYEASEDELRLSGVFSKGFFGFTDNSFKRLENADIESGKRIIEYCEKNYINIITPDDPDYPKRLLLVQNYPLVLFAKGDISCLNREKLAFGVVGTRKPSEYGIKAARQIARGLAKNGAVIVSGGALGIDSVAHNCAIEQNGKTILVMGFGHDSNYLSENAALREEVTRHGATLTEYPPFTKFARNSFPLRNRIISGVSNGVVVIEANLKSGTLNTAAHAKKQQRDVFAVPGDVSSVSYSGSNKLIIDGAHAVFSAKDVLERYKFELSAREEFFEKEPKTPFDGIDVFKNGENKITERTQIVEKAQKEDVLLPKNEEKPKIFKTAPESVSKNASLVYNVMINGNLSLDSIVRESNLSVRAVLIALTELEIAGAVSCAGGNNYAINS